MRLLLTNQTANITGEWMRFAGGPSPIEVVLQCDGLTEGADAVAVEVRYEGSSRVYPLYTFTEDGGRAVTPAGSYAGSFGWFELRAVLSEAQAETNVEVGVA